MNEELIRQFDELLQDIKIINDSYHATKSDLYREINRIDMTIMEFASKYPGCTIRDLRQKLSGVPQSTISISRLCKKGFLQRTINEEDSRSFRLHLTEKAAAIGREHQRVNSMLAADILNALDSDEERDFLIKLFAKIVQKMG